MLFSGQEMPERPYNPSALRQEAVNRAGERGYVSAPNGRLRREKNAGM
jgi:hypothetical protein